MAKVLSLGFGNIVVADQVKYITSLEPAPIRRIVSEAKNRNRIIDATYGRRTKSVIFTDSDYIILSAIEPEVLQKRLKGECGNPVD